eukprot:6192103-Pleurochrysis_carterae.AAC.1
MYVTFCCPRARTHALELLEHGLRRGVARLRLSLRNLRKLVNVLLQNFDLARDAVVQSLRGQQAATSQMKMKLAVSSRLKN